MMIGAGYITREEIMEQSTDDIKGPVTQDWVHRIPFMQQTVLLGIVRGPDGIEKYHPVKPVLRWYRRCLLLSALDAEVITNPVDPRGGSFTGPSVVTDQSENAAEEWELYMVDPLNKFFQTMDSMPIHFWLHMMHAVEIMGYQHPVQRIRFWWRELYMRMVAAMHLYPESKIALNARLGDDRSGWLARSDPAITK